MSYYTALAINLSCALLPVIGGGIRIKSLDKASRIFFAATCLSFITEGCAFVFAKAFHNNLPVYNIANIIQAFIIAMYFNHCIAAFQKRNAGLYIGVLSITLGILNLFFLEPLTQYNGNFFLYQSVLIFVMGAFYFRQIILPSYLEQYITPHLWITIILVSYSTLSFFVLSLYGYFSAVAGDHATWADNIILASSAIANGGFACVFFFYPKMNPPDAR